ncbi:SPOCS domain-containing protein [uncultured Clostridium sp.]|jgi:LysM repeat protein|uniref:DUF3794 and LysM peptidoglycan-binding domain-containing protein n=1 Tax=uncultured Clostridium sp. TaxID=59620 RepID=UPI002637A629|nr:SPOCS domain-containing protein [uncultured Clostridium sp.]
MANLDLIKENVELQIQVGENSNDDIIREEYLISDTLPDVSDILSVDVDKKITKAEVVDGKVLVEADIKYSIIYLSDEEEGKGVNNVVYKSKLSNFIDILGAEQGMFCNVECELEHINASLINERKINVEAYFRSKADVYKNEEFEFVQSVENRADIQTIKKVETVDKSIYGTTKNISYSSELKVSMDKSQIDKVVKFDYLLHKKDVKLYDDRVLYSCYAKVNVVYKSEESKELCLLEDDIFISDEEEVIGVSADYNCDFDFNIVNADYAVGQDDLGEERIINISFDVKSNLKVLKSEEIEVIEDAYSPEKELNLIKEKSIFSIRYGEGCTEAIAKDNVKLEDDEPILVISSKGEIVSIETEVISGCVNIDGTLKVNCLYKSANEDKCYGSKEIDLPFTGAIEIAGLTEDMDVVVKGTLESLTTAIEAGTIAVKGIVSFIAKASYKEEKEYINTIEECEESEAPKKKASVTIYVVECGDTIWKLAKKYNTTMDAIASANGIDLCDILEIGTKLIIPGRATI